MQSQIGLIEGRQGVIGTLSVVWGGRGAEEGCHMSITLTCGAKAKVGEFHYKTSLSNFPEGEASNKDLKTRVLAWSVMKNRTLLRSITFDKIRLFTKSGPQSEGFSWECHERSKKHCAGASLLTKVRECCSK